MYINYNFLDKNGFTWSNNRLLVLQCIKQKEYERLERCDRDLLNGLYKEGLITVIKGNASDPSYLKARLSKKGKECLRLVAIAEVTKESETLTKKLIDYYTQENLHIVNKTEVGRRVAWFMAETGLSVQQIYEATQNYINTCDKKYVMALDNLFWSPKNKYSSQYKLSESKLYDLMHNG